MDGSGDASLAPKVGAALLTPPAAAAAASGDANFLGTMGDAVDDAEIAAASAASGCAPHVPHAPGTGSVVPPRLSVSPPPSSSRPAGGLLRGDSPSASRSASASPSRGRSESDACSADGDAAEAGSSSGIGGSGGAHDDDDDDDGGGGGSAAAKAKLFTQSDDDGDWVEIGIGAVSIAFATADADTESSGRGEDFGGADDGDGSGGGARRGPFLEMVELDTRDMLMRTPVSVDDIYVVQRGSILIWQDPEIGKSVAVSFSTVAGCTGVMERIAAFQRAARQQQQHGRRSESSIGDVGPEHATSAAAAGSSMLNATESSIDDGARDSPWAVLRENLPALVLATNNNRHRFLHHVATTPSFFRDVAGVFQSCTASGDVVGQAHVAKLTMALLAQPFSSEQRVLMQLIDRQVISRTIDIVQHAINSDGGNGAARVETEAQRQAKFCDPGGLPADVVEVIHYVFALQHLRDLVPLYLDDGEPGGSMLGMYLLRTKLSIFHDICVDATFLPRLFAKHATMSPGSGAGGSGPAVAAESGAEGGTCALRQHFLTTCGFLLEMTSNVKNAMIAEEGKTNILTELVRRGVCEYLRAALSFALDHRADAAIVAKAADVMAHCVLFAPNAVRLELMRQAERYSDALSEREASMTRGSARSVLLLSDWTQTPTATDDADPDTPHRPTAAPRAPSQEGAAEVPATVEEPPARPPPMPFLRLILRAIVAVREPIAAQCAHDCVAAMGVGLQQKNAGPQLTGAATLPLRRRVLQYWVDGAARPSGSAGAAAANVRCSVFTASRCPPPPPPPPPPPAAAAAAVDDNGEARAISTPPPQRQEQQQEEQRGLCNAPAAAAAAAAPADGEGEECCATDDGDGGEDECSPIAPLLRCLGNFVRSRRSATKKGAEVQRAPRPERRSSALHAELVPYHASRVLILLMRQRFVTTAPLFNDLVLHHNLISDLTAIIGGAVAVSAKMRCNAFSLAADLVAINAEPLLRAVVADGLVGACVAALRGRRRRVSDSIATCAARNVITTIHTSVAERRVAAAAAASPSALLGGLGRLRGAAAFSSSLRSLSNGEASNTEGPEGAGAAGVCTLLVAHVLEEHRDALVEAGMGSAVQHLERVLAPPADDVDGGSSRQGSAFVPGTPSQVSGEEYMRMLTEFGAIPDREERREDDDDNEEDEEGGDDDADDDRGNNFLLRRTPSVRPRSADDLATNTAGGDSPRSVVAELAAEVAGAPSAFSSAASSSTSALPTKRFRGEAEGADSVEAGEGIFDD